MFRMRLPNVLRAFYGSSDEEEKDDNVNVHKKKSARVPAKVLKYRAYRKMRNKMARRARRKNRQIAA